MSEYNNDPPTQFYKGVILIGGSQIPVLGGADFGADENDMIPPIIGNYAQLNVAEGMITPVVNLSLAPRDKAGEALANAFLTYFLMRSNDAAHDTPVIADGFTFWDGRSGYHFDGAKADAFTLGGSAGDFLRFSVRLCGMGEPEPLTAAPGFTAYTDVPILSFPRLNFGGVYEDRVERWNISFSNNHTPDGSLVGARYPAGWNAGMWTAGMNLLMKTTADADAPQNGDPIPIQIRSALDPARIATVTVVNPHFNNPKSRNLSPPHVKRNHQLTCLAPKNNGQGCPITISSTF